MSMVDIVYLPEWSWGRVFAAPVALDEGHRPLAGPVAPLALQFIGIALMA
ncbi:MAG: hypothetical protein GY723_20540 [bacterium]|nr:hypothetical protein [bacterium]